MNSKSDVYMLGIFLLYYLQRLKIIDFDTRLLDKFEGIDPRNTNLDELHKHITLK